MNANTHVLMSFCFDRYNIYQRVSTLMEKIKGKKPVKLDAKFLPKKRKRVLNKRPLIVLNKKAQELKPAKRQRSPVVPTAEPDDENALDSQSSITSIFWDSQGLGATPPTSPVSHHNHTTRPHHLVTYPPHHHTILPL